MGLLGNILGFVADSIKDSSDSNRVEELMPRMMNSAIADDFERWFVSQLEEKSFLHSQYNFYDDCERMVIVDDDCVLILFEIKKTNLKDEVICNFATTLGYKPLSANGLTYSDGSSASERVLIKTFAEVVKERIKKVLNNTIGNYTFGVVEYDDGTSGSFWERTMQTLESATYESAKLHQIAGFTYTVPKQEQKSAF